MSRIKRSIRSVLEQIEISNFERRAILALLFFIIGIIAVRWLNSEILYSNSDLDNAQIDEFLALLKAQTETVEFEAVSFLHFDPNSANTEELILAGLPDRVAANIYNYRQSGAYFNSVDDLLKIYSMDSVLFEQIKPYVQIVPSSYSIARTKNYAYSKNDRPRAAATPKSFELNTATVDELVSLPGIGPVYAKRILAFRKLLGGFFRKSQLLEVYGLTDSTYRLIEQYLNLDTSQLLKININNADIQDLTAHPYMDYRNAKIIISFREQHGLYKTLDFENVRALDLDKMQKILAYLTIR